MKLIPTSLAFLVAAFATTGITHAQILTTGLFSTDSVLTLAGTPTNEVYAVAFGSSTASVTTGNGYVFLEDPVRGGIAPVTFGTTSGTLESAFFPAASGTTGDLNFDAVLNTNRLANSGTLVLGGLTAGTTYNLLLLEADTRSGFNPGSVHSFSVTDKGVTSATQQFLSTAANGSNALAPNLGGYIMDTFTATNVSETLTVNQPNGNQLTSILLETAAVPEPSSYALVLMGVAFLVGVLKLRNQRNQV
jgi:hypothetical protein